MHPWIERLWRWLLWAYPPEFRCEYGPEMTQAFADRYQEERGVSRCRLCLTTFLDVLATAAKERYYIMINDLRHSSRRLAAHPVITAVAVLSLALGIGANSGIFSIVHAVLLRTLPYPEVDRRVIVYTGVSNTQQRAGATTADFIDWRAASRNLEDWHMFSYRSTFTAIGAGLPERITLQHITPGLLESLGVRPVIGRFFRPGEEAERPALISEGYWTRRFGRKTDVLGKRLFVGDGVHTIIGVVPAGFELFDEPSGVSMWNTINLAPGSIWVQRKVPWLMATAKLKPGVTLQQAQADMNSIAAGLSKTYPESNAQRGVALIPMTEARRGNQGPVFYPLLGAVAFVLLIACTNVANLLLARAATRRREISVRAALGAARSRLMREFLADGLVLAVPAVLAGLALAYGGLALFRTLAPAGFPGVATVELNSAVLWFAAAAGLVAGILSAIFPALEGSRVDLTESLKEGARGSASRTRQRVRSCLVSGEVALALILLAGAGLMIGTVRHLQNHDPGFDPANVTVAQLYLTGPRYMTNAPQGEIDMRNVEPAVGLFIDHVLREARRLPGVENASLAGSVPLGPMSGSVGVRIRLPGVSEPNNELQSSGYTAVTSGFFETLRIPLRRGRYITDHDTAAAQWVAVVNETFVRQFFPGGDALGQVITVVPHGAGDGGERPRQIVGVIADHTQYTPRVPQQPQIYTSYLQQPNVIPGTLQGQRFRPSLIVRSRAASGISPETIGNIVADFDKELAVFDVRSLEQYIALRAAPTRFYAQTLGLFSAIAIVLAAIGIYGLMNYSVADRFHEIGIRLSLGATRRRVVWLIVSHGVKLAGVGIVLGIAGALAATRLLQRFLFGVQPWDLLTFSFVTISVLIVALAASALPAWRATRVDPVVALRQE